MEIKVEQTMSPAEKPDEANLGFGVHFTDHMFTMEYDTEKGWHNAKVVPFAPFTMSPAAMVFHYGQECFEGLKAFRTPEGKVQLFRPDRNAARMAATHKRLCIPEIPEEDFVQAVKALVEVDKDWVPSSEGASLYIRPCTIASEAVLGVRPSTKYLFFIIASPSGAYYSHGFNPVKIYVEDEYTRAAPGGTGAAKCGGNYAASLIGQQKAYALGYEQVLWLDGAQRRYVEEVGSMNCFFKINGEIYTAPTATGTVLPGITRMSCIELMKDWGYTVKEEPIDIQFIVSAAKNGQLEEVFGTGTAAVISPVGELRYKDELMQVNNNEIGPLTSRLYQTLTDLQWGRTHDDKGWMLPVE